MRPPLSAKFVDKAEAALVAAVEVYNKPSFRYREETFALLAINAWELLLKAQLLALGGNDPRVIRVYESQARTKAGKPSKKRRLRKNRAGTPMTCSLHGCVTALDMHATSRLGPDLKANLDALIAIRDNAAHYIHASPLLRKQVLEVAMAAVKNFIILSTTWFSRDMSDSLSLILPLSFISGSRDVDSVVVTAGENRLIKYLQRLAAADSDAGSPYSVAVRMQIKFERSKLTSASKVQITNDPDAVKVILTEDDIRDRYPWDHKTLVSKCVERYAGFKQNARFSRVKKSALDDSRYVHSRLLNPREPRSSRMNFYSSAMLDVLDKEYARL